MIKQLTKKPVKHSNFPPEVIPSASTLESPKFSGYKSKQTAKDTQSYFYRVILNKTGLTCNGLSSLMAANGIKLSKSYISGMKFGSTFVKPSFNLMTLVCEVLELSFPDIMQEALNLYKESLNQASPEK